MDQEARAQTKAAIEIVAPAEQTAALVFSSPHSGRDYPEEFLAASRLDSLAIRRSEDAFVDELFGDVPHCGAPLLKALFPRAYIDPNREPYELDPAMFAERLPDWVNTRSPRVAAGLGTIARLVASGAEIYRERLAFADAAERVEGLWRPYHAALEDLIAQTRRQFGYCVLIDCHSMPSVAGPMEDDAGLRRRVDIILGDGHGTSCSRALSDFVADTLTGLGYSVTRNTPYSGGFITRHYGRPRRGVHALQIEINRALYMDEGRLERGARLAAVAADMRALAAGLAAAGAGAVAA